jgi:hypothetical protein
MALINGELDIEVPNISIDAIDIFVKESKELHTQLGHSKEEDIYFERNKRHYPWNRRVLQYKNTYFHSSNTREEFKEVYKVMDQLPIKEENRIVLLLQQNEQQNYDFDFHFDNDTPFGFRICLGLDINKVFLEQSKIKDTYKNHALQLGKIDDNMVEDSIYEIRPAKENTVLILNGYEFPHRVPLNNSSGRAVFVVRGKLESLDKLIFLRKEEE